jgi:RNA polymerase sigma-70 factor (ECF subfamily)
MRKLDGLPEDRREALIMRFALGMSNREIARALGRTDGATKVLIHRALKQLEEQIASENEPQDEYEDDIDE